MFAYIFAGVDASVAELADFICAAQMSKAADAFLPEEKVKFWFLIHFCSPPIFPPFLGEVCMGSHPIPNVWSSLLFLQPWPNLSVNDIHQSKKRKLAGYNSWKRNLIGDKKPCADDEQIRLPNPMVGFGVPTDSSLQQTCRNLPEAAIGPPYFYYENVALAPKGVWDTISRFLYDVEPEFVDSRYFCAAARKRGYVHNLPVQNRSPLRPIPPLTISEAFPLTKRWWPSWDTRTKLNCLQTCIASAKLTERIRKAVEDYESEPPLHIQNYVLNECRKWNLVWVGRNKVAPLEPDEVEMLLGFPRNHTRGGGISRTDRYKSLGNSFQVFFLSFDIIFHSYYGPLFESVLAVAFWVTCLVLLSVA